MDTTYFGRDFGVMVLMDSISGQALFVGEVKQRDMFRAGLVLNIVSIAVVTLFAYYIIL